MSQEIKVYSSVVIWQNVEQNAYDQRPLISKLFVTDSDHDTALAAKDQEITEKDKQIKVLVDACQFALVHFLDKVIKPTDESEVFTTGRIQLKQALRSVGEVPLEPDITESLKRIAESLTLKGSAE
jgi:hypothetical protein